MDDTTKSIIDKITLSLATPKEIPGGYRVKVFYDCVQLSPNDLARLAAQATGHLAEGVFDIAVGIAYSGILFASAVASGQKVSILQIDGKLTGPEVKGKKVIVVDDVVCTGSRVCEAEKIIEQFGGKVVGYACIVDRSCGKFGLPDKPLWSAFQAEMN